MSATKDQWIEKTGGFRIGETPADFQTHASEIQTLEASLKSGTLDMNSLERVQRRLCALKGIDFDDDSED